MGLALSKDRFWVRDIVLIKDGLGVKGLALKIKVFRGMRG